MNSVVDGVLLDLNCGWEGPVELSPGKQCAG